MKKLIGGGALAELGSSRHTEDKDYLVFYEASKEMFIKEDGGDLINANGHPFFKEIYESERLYCGSYASKIKGSGRNVAVGLCNCIVSRRGKECRAPSSEGSQYGKGEESGRERASRNRKAACGSQS